MLLTKTIWFYFNWFNKWNDRSTSFPCHSFTNEFFPIFNSFNPSMLNLFTFSKQSSPISIDPRTPLYNQLIVIISTAEVLTSEHPELYPKQYSNTICWVLWQLAISTDDGNNNMITTRTVLEYWVVWHFPNHSWSEVIYHFYSYSCYDKTDWKAESERSPKNNI